jgi:hypothetical protein
MARALLLTIKRNGEEIKENMDYFHTEFWGNVIVENYLDKERGIVPVTLYGGFYYKINNLAIFLRFETG